MRSDVSMKLTSLLVLPFVALAAFSAAGQTTFEFALDGGQEVPATATAATGSAVGILDAGETSFDLTITHDVANPTMAHIHLGLPGTNGPVVFDLGSPASPIVVTWNLAPGDVSDLLAGELYVNIHSTEEPAGEIRGQIVQDCRTGTVNSGAGAIADVLYLNGSTGGVDRAIDIDTATEPFLWGAILPSPAGTNGKYVVHGNLGTPTGATARVLPADVGTSCFPFLVSGGATPSIVANNIGKAHLVGASDYFGSPASDPGRAPAICLQAAFPDTNLPPGTVLTLQGVTVDLGSASPKGASSTNAVIATIL